MQLDDYIEQTFDTAVYPGVNTGSPIALAYVALGLLGESQEFFETGKTDIAEAGDVCWYAARLLAEVEQHIAPDHDVRPFKPYNIAELVKKHIRDGSDPGRLRLIQRAALDTLYSMSVHIGGLDKVFEANIAKLQSRKARQVIQGDGDHR